MKLDTHILSNSQWTKRLWRNLQWCDISFLKETTYLVEILLLVRESLLRENLQILRKLSRVRSDCRRSSLYIAKARYRRNRMIENYIFRFETQYYHHHHEWEAHERACRQMSDWVGKWASELANERASGQMSEQVGKWASKWANEWMSGQMSEWVGKWASEWANEQASGQMSKQVGKWANKWANE